MDFRWNDWNLSHATRHGVRVEEAETVVEQARRPWPEEREDERWLVWGRTGAGRMLQVVYILDFDGTVYVIHARPLTDREKRNYRRRAGGRGS